MVEKLLVDVLHKVTISNQISRFHSILINKGSNFFRGKGNAQELHSRSQARNKFVFDAVAFPEFIVILKESFDSDLFSPNLSPDMRLDFVDGFGVVLVAD